MERDLLQAVVSPIRPASGGIAVGVWDGVDTFTGYAGFRSAAAVSPERRVAVVVLSSQVRGLTRIGLRLLGALR